MTPLKKDKMIAVEATYTIDGVDETMAEIAEHIQRVLSDAPRITKFKVERRRVCVRLDYDTPST